MEILYECEHCQCTLMAAAHDRYEFFCLGCQKETVPVMVYGPEMFNYGPERETAIRDQPQS